MPVHPKPQVIVRMYHFMSHCVLHMTAIPHLIRAQKNPIVHVESSAHALCAPPTAHVFAVDVMTQSADLVAKETHGGRVLEEVVAVRFATRTVRGFAFDVPVEEI